MRTHFGAGGAVHARISFEIPMAADRVWEHMRDFRRFICVDPLHQRARFTTPGNDASPAGRTIVVEHRLLGCRVDRVGRVLKWTEGTGFAFSDLSRRGVHVGFPHVCYYRLDSLTPTVSRLTVGARGKWTSRSFPRWAARLWLKWVLAATKGCIIWRMTRAALAASRSPHSS